MVPYVDTVVAVTVMCVLLFVLYGFMLREWQCWCGGWRRCGCGECRPCVWYTWFMYCV